MAITTPITESPTSLMERTWRLNIEVPIDSEPSIQVYRWSVPVDGSGNPMGKGQQNYQPINRTLAGAGEETVRLEDGTSLTLNQIGEALSLFGDQWATEDKEGGGANPSEPPPGRG
jgi:hypothetical protein